MLVSSSLLWLADKVLCISVPLYHMFASKDSQTLHHFYLLNWNKLHLFIMKQHSDMGNLNADQLRRFAPDIDISLYSHLKADFS